MAVSVFDKQFHEDVLAIYFQYEAGKQNAETTLDKLKSKLKEAEDSKHFAHQGKVLEYIGSVEYHRNNLDAARNYYEQARRAYFAGQHHHLTGMLDLNIGNIYYLKGWIERSKDYYRKAYSLAERYQYTALQAFALNNFGHLLYLTGEYQQAEKTLMKAYALGQSPWNDFADEDSDILVKFRQRNNLNLEENLALLALAQERYELAWEHAQKGAKLSEELELTVNIAHFARLLGSILHKMPTLSSTKAFEDYYNEACRDYETLNMPLDLCQTQIEHAKCLFDTGQKEAAQALLAVARKTAIAAGLTKEMVDINDVEVLWRTKA